MAKRRTVVVKAERFTDPMSAVANEVAQQIREEGEQVKKVPFAEWLERVRRGTGKAIRSLIEGKGLNPKILNTNVSIPSRNDLESEIVGNGTLLEALREAVVIQLIHLLNQKCEEITLKTDDEASYWKSRMRTRITLNTEHAVDALLRGIEISTEESRWTGIIHENLKNPCYTIITDFIDHLEKNKPEEEENGKV